MFLRHYFSENDVAVQLFIFIYLSLILLLIKIIYTSNSRKFCVWTFSINTNQLVHQLLTNQPKTNQAVATGGQIKLTIDHDMIFVNANTENIIKVFDAGGLKVCVMCLRNIH